MFLNNLTTLNKEKVRDAVLVELENFGLKNEIPKKITKHNRRPDGVGNVFRIPLDRLPVTNVRLPSGVEVEVSNFINEACQCVLRNVGVEGLFRKAGSTARQREIKVFLDAGHRVSLGDHHVIDVASVLKLFFRELPESLVPAQWHNAFVRCLDLGVNASPALLLMCLLLPPSNLAALAYLMQILREVASHSDTNKMDQTNLAIILAPTVMPVQISGRLEKASLAAVHLNNHVKVVEILISHAQCIGLVPDHVGGPIESSSSSSSLREGSSLRRSLTRNLKKRRRRSASLTRMINRLRKIVGARGSPDGSSSEEETPTTNQVSEYSTPCVKPSKKRKANDMPTSGLSTKKKREVLQLLPQSCPLADTPFTPSRPSALRTLSTPAVSIDPSPTLHDKSSPKHGKMRFFRRRSTSESDKPGKSSKTSLLSMGGKVTKKHRRSESGKEPHQGGFLERSWSAVSNTSQWGRRKFSRLSLLSTSAANNVDTDSETLVEDSEVGVDLSLNDEPATPLPSSDPVACLSARQYADIERRVSDMETRISTEFNQALNAASAVSPEPLRAADTAQAVQTVYQRTLEGSERLLDSSADQLARRLSQQLKIRRRSEARVIRSPSARKIGSIRKELRRNKSWHTLQNCGSHLRRGRPNTVASGLPQVASNRVPRWVVSTLATASPGVLRTTPDPNKSGLPAAGAPPKRASSFHFVETVNSAGSSSAKKFSSQINIAQKAHNSNNSGDEKWFDAVETMSRLRPRLSPAPLSHRDSIARLRNENAGMVLAKARLFGAAAAPSRARAVPASQSKLPTPSLETRMNVSTQTDGSSTPRRQTTPIQCPVNVPGRLLRPRPSPPVASIMNEARRVKKHNSMSIDRAQLTHPVRRNLSTPSHWPDASRDKENRVGKLSSSQAVATPLRDSNRKLSSTPAPAIKPALGTRVPRRIISTPNSVRGRPTPLRALGTPAAMNSPRHKSPRVAMGARALVVRSRH